MSKADWPTGAESAVFATSMGVTIPAGLDLDELAEAARVDFEDLTGYDPFLEAASAAYTYDPPGWEILQLRCGFTAITAVTVGADDTVYTIGTDVWKEPVDAPQRGAPYTQLRFRHALTGDPQTVTVTGTKGYASAIPSDAWIAVASRAAILGAGFVAGTSATKQKVGSVAVEYGGGETPIGHLRSLWDRAIAKYRLVVV